MAKCKYCHENITRLDKEVCPFCGGLKPLEGTDESTQDITKVIGDISGENSIVYHSKIIAALLAFFLGIFGAHMFYIGKKKNGFITLVISLLIIGGFGSIIYFCAWANPFAYLILFFVFEALMICVGIGFLTRHDIVDNKGVFLK